MTGARRVVATEVKDKKAVNIKNGDIAIGGSHNYGNSNAEPAKPLKKKNDQVKMP